jgi:murein L,D-transpeptidase YcbB/YkuD
VLKGDPPPADASDAMPAVEANPMDADIQAFYQARNFQPAWSGSAEAESNAAMVRDVLERAGEQGLRPRDYLGPLSQAKDPGSSQYDRAFTKALFRYAYDVRFGRVSPASVYRDVNLASQRFDIGPYLARSMERRTLDQFLADLPPHQPGYRALVAALARYRGLSAADGLPAVGGSSEASHNVLSSTIPSSRPIRLRRNRHPRGV